MLTCSQCRAVTELPEAGARFIGWRINSIVPGDGATQGVTIAICPNCSGRRYNSPAIERLEGEVPLFNVEDDL